MSEPAFFQDDFENKIASPDELLFAFREFDLDDDGLITRSELKMGYRKFGQKITLVQADQIIQEVDLSNKGAIGFEDFCLMMQG